MKQSKRSFKFALSTIIRGLIWVFISFTLLLDKLFFPLQSKIRKPIFVIGHLRSGTTFLHRFMCDNCTDLKGMRLLEMLFPAITAQKILAPLIPLLNKISLDHIYDPKIHRTDLSLPETDDIAIHFRYGEGILSWVYFDSWQKYPSNEELQNSVRKSATKEKFIHYLGLIHRNNIYKSSRRIISKSFFAIFNIETILKQFPEAKIIILLRDPLQAVPSLMSLEKSVQTGLYNFENQNKTDKARFFQNLYAMSLLYYQYSAKVISDHRFKNNLILVTYDNLKDNFRNTILGIMDHCDLEISIEMFQAIEAQIHQQMNYTTGHKYQLSDFGFNTEQLQKDFSFIYPFLKSKDCTKPSSRQLKIYE